MKKIILLTLIILGSINTMMAQTDKAKSSAPTLRHVVMFKFKDGTGADQVKAIEKEFGALKEKITTIKDFEWGVNNSPENLNQGLTHCFFLTFQSAKDRDDYLVHPAHKAFVAMAGPQIDKATVLDYWVHK